MVVPISKFYGKIWVSFCLTTGKRFLLYVSFQNQQKQRKFFYKTVVGIFKIALLLKDRHVFVWHLVQILNVLNTVILKWIFWKTKTFIKKLEYRFLVESNKIENASFPYKTAISKANVKANEMATTKWVYQKERTKFYW